MRKLLPIKDERGRPKGVDVAQFYELDSASYDKERFISPQGIYTNRIRKEIITGMVDCWQGKKILEVGTGTGILSIAVSMIGASVVSSDITGGMLTVARERALQAGASDSISLVRMDAQSLAIKDAIFDGCICINVLNHVREDKRVLKEISRILKPGGFLIVNFPIVVSFYLPIALYVNLSQRSIQGDVYSKWFTFSHIKQSFSDAGLRIRDTKGSITFPRGKTPQPFVILLRTLDRAVRHSLLKYISGNMFIKAVKVI